MNTTIERAARALHNLGCMDQLVGEECTHNPTEWHSLESTQAHAAFESIDRDELVKVLGTKRIHTNESLGKAGADADAILAHLTGE